MLERIYPIMNHSPEDNHCGETTVGMSPRRFSRGWWLHQPFTPPTTHVGHRPTHSHNINSNSILACKHRRHSNQFADFHSLQLTQRHKRFRIQMADRQCSHTDSVDDKNINNLIKHFVAAPTAQCAVRRDSMAAAAARQ